jgi:GAF domain-containing protein
VDYDIFNLLGTHAASALEAARLRAEARSSKHGFALFEEIN